jgi:hypothetical protein
MLPIETKPDFLWAFRFAARQPSARGRNLFFALPGTYSSARERASETCRAIIIRPAKRGTGLRLPPRVSQVPGSDRSLIANAKINAAAEQIPHRLASANLSTRDSGWRLSKNPSSDRVLTRDPTRQNFCGCSVAGSGFQKSQLPIAICPQPPASVSPKHLPADRPRLDQYQLDIRRRSDRRFGRWCFGRP